MRKPAIRKIALKLSYLAFGSFCLFLLLDVVFPFRFKVPYSQLIVTQEGEVIHAFLSSDDKWRMKVELDEINDDLEKAILAKEDRYFRWHFGVNPIAIGRALVNNMSAGKTTSGASTITMQVARLLVPKERTYANKLLEIFRAMQLEWHYSKDEILQLYLNLVPYGGNIEGVKSASILFFGRNPDQLSLAQIVTLTIIPNRPTSLALGKYNETIQQERNKWLTRLQHEEIFAEEQVKDALAEPLKAYRRAYPQLAPHYAYWLHQQMPFQNRIVTGIDANIQDKVNGIVQNYSKRQAAYNINNAAALVVDNQTKNVLAYLGSSDFWDNEHAGQVDGIQAIRSPGSTLKPLLYGTSFDLGMYTPQAIVNDVPMDFDGYSPENFNKKFNGSISIENALASSLNVTAVQLLKEMGVTVFIEQLKKASFKQVAMDEHQLGLSLALGGCGTSLYELCGLYSALATAGEYRPLQNQIGKGNHQKHALLRAESAYMVTEILTKLTRPDLPNGYQNSHSVPRIAWKTGTSHRRRDAWAIGYNREYTIGVWLGNFNGEGVRELTGASKAAPLLFELFNALVEHSDDRWNLMPKGLQFRYVCTESGLPSEHFCETEHMDYFIPLVSSNKKCTHLQQVFISEDGTESYCSHCLPQNGYKKAWFPNHDPALISYFITEKIPYLAIPKHHTACSKILTANPPKVVSPLHNREYILTDGKDSELMLACHAANDVSYVYWYINNQFYKKVKATESLFFKPTAGEVTISCVDDRGRNTSIRIQVSY
ncbi:MAG: penicillin-binding protein 1C [Flammeovirgaceae bacterium]